MRILVCFVAAIVLVQVSATANAKRVPQFLSEPLTPAKRETYYKILDRKLLKTPAEFGRMTFRPAFEGEFAVSVYARNACIPDAPVRVTLTEATKSLWYSLAPNQQGYIPAPGVKHNERDTSSQIPVKRIDVDIDRELTLAIQRTWQAMLARDPVPDPDAERYLSVDGYSAEFSVRMGRRSFARHQIRMARLRPILYRSACYSRITVALQSASARSAANGCSKDYDMY